MRLLVCLALGCLALAQGAGALEVTQNHPKLLNIYVLKRGGGRQRWGCYCGAAVGGGPYKHTAFNFIGAASTTPQASTPLPSTIPATTIAAVASTPPPTTSAATSTAPLTSTPPPTTSAASSTTSTSSAPPSTTVPASTPSIPPSTTQAATTQPPTTSPAVVPMHGFRVLATGGQNNGGIIKTSQLYSDITGKWTATGSVTTPRRLFNIVRLLDGRALLAGGININAIVLSGGAVFITINPGTTITELYNATSGSWDNVYSAEVYDNKIGVWKATGAPYAAPGRTSRYDFVMVALPDGNALAAGGLTTSPNFDLQFSTTSEVYNTTTGNWNLTGSSSTSRVDFGMVVL
ncbi:g5560 [Coccomyxa elongata]